MALLAVILAAAMVLSTQAALARPIISDGGADTGSTSGGTISMPIPGQTIYTVAFSEQADRDRVTDIVQANSGRMLAEFPSIDAIAVCVPDGVAGQLRVVPGVRYVEADVEYRFSMDETAEQVDIRPLWDGAGTPGAQYDGHGIVVCVIDSGAATWHPDLRGRIDRIYNFVPGEAPVIDTSGANYVNGIDNSISGHGTFVASQIVGSGIASMATDGGPGIYKGTLPGYAGKIARDDPEYVELRGPFRGLAPGVTLYPMRVSVGSGASSLAIKLAIQKAIDLDADVVSMSMNSGVEDQSMNDLVAQAVAAGIVFVVSAGNAGDDPGTVQCPGNLPQVITVGAVTRNDEVAGFSSRGPTRAGVMKPDITAVGETVIAASRALADVNGPATPAYDPENNFQRYYQEYSGTSMSTPEVAAAAAIVMQRYSDLYPARPGLAPEQVKQVLIKSARHPYGCPADGDPNWGSGVLDIYAAIRMIEQDQIPTPDLATVPSAYFERPEYTVSESGGSFSISIIASDVPSNGIKLKAEAFSGSGAIPGQDFKADTRILAFTPDNTAQAFPVEIIDNPLPETQKVFTVKLSPENAADRVFIPAETCKVTIRDDDQAVVSFAVDSYTVMEQSAGFSLPVRLKADWTGNPAAGDITVRVRAIDGSATAGFDYTPVTPIDQIVTIEQDSGNPIVEQTIDVEILPSSGAEGLEYFTVKLSDPVNAVLGDPGVNTVWVRPSATDTAAPQSVSCSTPTPPADGWYTSSVQVDITAADNPGGSGIDYLKYSVNDGPVTTVDGGQAHPFITGNGVNILEYRATDQCGNVLEGTPVVVRIDLAPPVTVCTMQADNAVPGRVSVTLAASDGAPGEGAGVATTYYRKPGDATFQLYSGEFAVQDGSGAIEFYSVDVAGHQEAVKSRLIQVDTRPPVTTCSLGGTPAAGGWYNEDVIITLSATDEQTGVQSTEYKLNDLAWAPYLAPFTISSEGENTMSYRSTDLAGNAEVARTIEIKIDRTPPISTCPYYTEWTNAETVQVTLEATDYLGPVEGGSGLKFINYSLDGTTWISYTPSAEPCTFAVTTPENTAAITTVLYYAEDLAGNIETGTVDPYAPFNGQRIKVDRIAPEIDFVVTPASPAPDGWYYGTVMVQYTATDSGGSGINGLSSFTDTIEGPGVDLPSEWTVSDHAGNVVTVSAGSFDIRSAVLTLGSITAPAAPVAEGSAEATISVSAPYTGGPVTRATWTWDDGTAGTPGTVTSDMITGTHRYTKPGIYTITLTIEDATGSSVSAKYEYVVVFDPSSLLTGAGRASSPVGAYYASPAKGGVDIFATHSQYIRGRMLACSFCNFNYNSGTLPWDDLLFLSTSSDWMVVTGNKGYYQGTGVILEKRAGAKLQYMTGYKFLFAGLDVSGGKDKFRMKIWNPATGQVKYDSQFGAPIDADATSTINSGNVFVKG